MSIHPHMRLRVSELLRLAMALPAPRGRVMALVCVFSLVLVSCSDEPAATITTTTSAPTTTSTTLPPDPAVDGPVFRVGMTSNITTANWWAALDTEATVENQALLAGTKESMFRLTVPGFALAPSLAATAEPMAVSQQGSVWVVDQPLHDGVVWSDGEPVTADDLVFYFDVVREFDLGGSHAASFPATVADISALDDHTLRVEFGEPPSLTTWHTGVAMAPFVPSHFWEPHVEAARQAADAARTATSDEEARAAVAAATLEDADPGNDLTPEEVAPTDVIAYQGRVAAAAGRDHLYGLETPQEPSAGPLVFEAWEDDRAVTRSNPDYFARGTETTLYSDGSVRVAGGLVGDEVFGGSASGSVEAHHVVGPFVSGVEWIGYGDEAEAYAALSEGRVDYVFDPDGMGFSRYNELATRGDIGLSRSVADGFRFLAFNLRKPPMSDPVFRRAVATIIDKELIASTLFNGTVFPAYTIVPPALSTSYEPDVDRPGWSGGEPMSEGQRFETAIAMLVEAGYTWDVEPEVLYDDEGRFLDVVPGGGLEMPNGVDVPALTILAAPGTGDDPVRATYALWIARWMRDLGITVETDLSHLDAVADMTLQPDSAETLLSWDLHVLGWGRPNLALPGLTLVALFHSRNGVETGGLNTTGYASVEFDTAADSFVAARSLGEAARWTREMERLIATDLPYLTLFRPAVIEAFDSRVEFPVDAIIGGHGDLPHVWPESVRIRP